MSGTAKIEIRNNSPWVLSKKAKIAHMISVGHFSNLKPTDEWLAQKVQTSDDLELAEILEGLISGSEDEEFINAAKLLIEDNSIHSMWDFLVENSLDDQAAEIIQDHALGCWEESEMRSAIDKLKTDAAKLRREFYDKKNNLLSGIAPADYHKINDKIYPYFAELNLHGPAIKNAEGLEAKDVILDSFANLSGSESEEIETLYLEVIDALNTDAILTRQIVDEAYKEFEHWIENMEYLRNINNERDYDQEDIESDMDYLF